MLPAINNNDPGDEDQERKLDPDRDPIGAAEHRYDSDAEGVEDEALLSD